MRSAKRVFYKLLVSLSRVQSHIYNHPRRRARKWRRGVTHRTELSQETDRGRVFYRNANRYGKLKQKKDEILAQIANAPAGRLPLAVLRAVDR